MGCKTSAIDTHVFVPSAFLGFLGYAQGIMDKRELSPEVFMRVAFIEAYVEFLKVGSFSVVVFWSFL